MAFRVVVGFGEQSFISALFSVIGDDLSGAASRVILLATRGGVRLVTAESVTGGMVGSFLTGVSGASAVYGGGIVSYGDGAKAGLLGVSREDLAREGAVSVVVARAMVRGLLSGGEAVWGAGRLLGVAVSGYAGAGREQEKRQEKTEAKQAVMADRREEEVGLIFVAVGFAGEGEVRVEEHRLSERERGAIREGATLLALEALERSLRLIL